MAYAPLVHSGQGDGAPGDRDAELGQAKRERDLYRRLVELGTQEEVEPFLDEALALIIAITRARRGYIELQRDSLQPRGAAESSQRRFSMARGCSESDLEEIREAFSGGVIDEVLATGKTLVTASALTDPRFRERGSVRRNRIEAVLCAPIGTPALGVLYLQDRDQTGPFSEDDRALAEIFSRYLAVFADRLLIRRRRMDEADPTAPHRRSLRAEGVIGRSQALAGVLAKVSHIAPLEVSVLLTGPSGTGKTQIARVIHDSGKRAAKNFREVNCAALPDALLENELFGAVKGGHSGGEVEGKIKAANGGTLFLDEVGDMPLLVQAKLLQFLQSKQYYPIGSSRPLVADVRIIAATNVDLKAAIARREFREDLFYRLDVYSIRLPSLAERREDLADLAAHFCREACESHGLLHLQLSVGARLAIESCEWPGNVRELANRVEKAAIDASAEGVLWIERHHLFPEMAGAEPDHERMTWQQATRRFQQHYLRRTLDELGWNVKEAASRLDLARSHVYNLMRELGVDRPRK